jgi:hypothetical protein
VGSRGHGDKSALPAPAGSGVAARATGPGRPYGLDIPSLGDALDEAPYYIGEQLVDVLTYEGGNAAVDAAFRDPPRTTEQVLDPRAYLGRSGPLPVDPPTPAAPAGRVETQTSLGALNLYLVLAAGIDPVVALDAATGWGGESAVAYDDAAGRSCVDVAVVGDTGADTSEIGEAFAAWADSGVAAQASTSRRSDGAHVLTACDPGSGPSATDPYDALALAEARGVQTWAAMEYEDLGAEAAFAFGGCVVHEVPLSTFLSTSEDGEAQDALDEAAARC